jgi:long-chain fatty acid transport protein
LAYKARPDLTVTGDWQRTNWSEFRIDVDYKTPGFALTNKDYSADWKDSDRYRLGLEYKPTDKWALRTGYFFDKTPVRDKSVSMSNIADVDRHNIVFGVGRELRQNIQLDLVYHYAWGNRTVNGVHYEQKINSVGVSLACKF